MERERPRHRRRLSIERLALALSGFASVTVGLLDLIGVLDVPALAQKLPQLTLLISGLVLTILAVNVANWHFRLGDELAELRKVIEDNRQAHDDDVRRLTEAVNSSIASSFPTLIERVDPALLKIFRPYLENTFRTPVDVLNRRHFQLHDMESYRSYHRRAHEVNPGATFLATSLPYRKWFWIGDYVERTISNFIANGGSIVRIFFIRSAGEVTESAEVREILDGQARLGVQVLLVNASDVPSYLRKFFLVDDERSFGWEAVRGPDDRVASINVTADPVETARYHSMFQQLKQMAIVHQPGFPIRRAVGAGGNVSVNIAANPVAFREFEFSGWQGAVDRYHESWGALTIQAADSMLDAISVTGPVKLLDVASGPGYVASAAAARGAEVIGLDFSPHMVEKARHLYPAVDFQEGDAENIPFPDDTFDAVSMNFGMLHLGNPEKAISEAFRVLRPKGRFGFTVWAPPEEAVGFSVILTAVAEFGQQVAIPHGPDFFYYSRPDECRVALTTAGFSAPNIMLLDLNWCLNDIDALFPAFLKGTARTGGLLRAQNESTRVKIAQRVRETASQFQDAQDGSLSIPMPAILAWAVKP